MADGDSDNGNSIQADVNHEDTVNYRSQETIDSLAESDEANILPVDSFQSENMNRSYGLQDILNSYEGKEKLLENMMMEYSRKIQEAALLGAYSLLIAASIYEQLPDENNPLNPKEETNYVQDSYNGAENSLRVIYPNEQEDYKEAA
ncbi:MAG: hypothetical protein ACQER9_04770 [Nanobdellota archaeon]